MVDETGAVTSTTFDRYDKPTAVTYNNGTSIAYTYDRAVEPRGFVTKVTDSVAGVIVPSWGPDGQLESQSMPGGVTLTIGCDSARTAVARTYTRDSDGTVIATDSVIENHKGQWIRHSSTTADRTYTFDTHGNRTALTTTTSSGTSGSDCVGEVVTASTSFDTADRITSSTGGDGGAWTYDGLGRMTVIPASAVSTYAATNAASAVEGGQGASSKVGFTYFVNDLTHTQVQEGSSKTTLALDAIGRFTSSTLTTWDPATSTWSQGATTTNHYDTSSDRPAWTETNTTNGPVTTRYVDGPTGDLTLTTNTTGGRTLLLTDLHGDTQATLPIPDNTTEANWTTLTYTATDEYGNPTPLTTASNAGIPDTYRWHSTAQRQTTRLGTTLMGARTYLPTLGTFTSMDPIPGGNTTTYTYPTDPINQHDLTGQFKINWRKVGKWAAIGAGIAGAIACGASIVCGVAVGAAAGAAGYAAMNAGTKNFSWKGLAGAAAIGGALGGLSRARFLGDLLFKTKGIGADSRLFGSFGLRTPYVPKPPGGLLNRKGIPGGWRIGWSTRPTGALLPNGRKGYASSFRLLLPKNIHVHIFNGKKLP